MNEGKGIKTYAAGSQEGQIKMSGSESEEHVHLSIHIRVYVYLDYTEQTCQLPQTLHHLAATKTKHVFPNINVAPKMKSRAEM